MRTGVGYSDIPDSAEAGRIAAEKAVESTRRDDPCSIAFLFCTSRHDQRVLREAVSSVIGTTVPIFGGGAVGIITNNVSGYAGDQVGVACFWLDGADFNVVSDGELMKCEEDTGFRLGQGLSNNGIKQESPVMLLFDSVYCEDSGSIRANMAMRILGGIKKAMGFLPNITGIGMQSDHISTAVSQFTGADLGEQSAMALTFGEEIRIDSVSVHGYRPVSPFYTITKVDKHIVLEINNRPALEFMDELLGSAITPEQYPFFLMFGIRGRKQRENIDSNRLCLGIDHKRGGIIMFDSDMEQGTEFQLMLRSQEPGSMQPKIESLFANLGERKPVFAMYIDCAGRCAGYGGTKMEDAAVVQQAVDGRVPLLGIYTGVEIASVAGHPRGLECSGVFCLFSRGERGVKCPPCTRAEPPMPSEAVVKLCERNAAELLALDSQSILLRHELDLKRRGFKLLSELAVSLRRGVDYGDMFIRVASRINSALNMQKTLVMLRHEVKNDLFEHVVLQGFTAWHQNIINKRLVSVPPELLETEPIIVTSEDSPERLNDLRKRYDLKYFIASPIVLCGEVEGILITGRMVEQPPFIPRLCQCDVETVYAITELLGSILVRRKLDDVTITADTDALTTLWNRKAFRRIVEKYLENSENIRGAFMIVDADDFKSVNDTYGHQEGDRVLTACADRMRSVLRDTDIIGRQSGDEFVVFCHGITSFEAAGKKAADIIEAWKKIFPGDGTSHITASIGVAISPGHDSSFDDLFDKADTALYKAKELGRNCYVVHGQFSDIC